LWLFLSKELAKVIQNTQDNDQALPQTLQYLLKTNRACDLKAQNSSSGHGE
ncbi:Hypothetical predicted protein, partial [Marmota monax]